MEQTFSTNAVAAVAGVTSRQLQWWDEHDIVSPRQEGGRRAYTREQLRLVILVNAFGQRGFTGARKHIAKTVKLPEGKPCWVVGDGSSFHVATEPVEAVEIATRATRPTATVFVPAI